MQYIRDAQVSVAATSVNILPANLNRVSYSITNTSALVNITVSRGHTAVDKEGGYLLPKGTISESDDARYTCWKGEVAAIGDAAGPTVLAITEVIEVDEPELRGFKW